MHFFLKISNEIKAAFLAAPELGSLNMISFFYLLSSLKQYFNDKVNAGWVYIC